MRKIYKIPVLGYIVRWIDAIVKLPKKFELLFQNQEALLEKINDENKTLQQKIEEQQQRVDDIRKTIEQVQKTILQSVDDIVELRGKALEHEKTILQSVEDIVDLRENSFDRMIGDSSKLEKLNTELSIYPTIWGDKERLNISPLSAVNSCTFNTNSGNITIGDYTFAGSNVSVLAGSHDKRLKGLLRRDAELHEGCDIEIGDGVWLASNCTVLGPCTIGDNAIVAAGAVVLPKTHIPANSVYAGIPAVFKGWLNENVESEAILDALDREDGILFSEGWTEKREIQYDNCIIRGHWLTSNNAYICVRSKQMKLLCVSYAEDNVTINFDDVEININKENMSKIIILQNPECELKKIFVECSVSEIQKIFVGVLK